MTSPTALPRPPLVAVAGLPGTGTTTLCRQLSQRLGLPHVYAGQIFRQLAAEHNMDVNGFSEYAETHPGIDTELDRRMMEIAAKRGVVLEGRMSAWHLLKAEVGGLKVLLEAPEDIRAKRVANREGIADADLVLVQNRHREASEAKRYREYYGFDPNDPRHYDLVLESSNKTPDEIAEIVVAKLFP